MPIRIALAHLSPEKSQLEKNRDLIRRALLVAQEAGADLFVTPELATSGYYFKDEIGLDWITSQPDEFAYDLARQAATSSTAVMLCTAEREGDVLYNACLVFNEKGVYQGKHRKIAVQPGSEEWSTAGTETEVFRIHNKKFAVMICADAWRPWIAQSFKKKGAQIFICPSAWPPEPCPPAGCWQKRALETDTALLVCNRTGKEPRLDFKDGQSLLTYGGNDIATATSDTSAVFIFEWDDNKKELTKPLERILL